MRKEKDKDKLLIKDKRYLLVFFDRENVKTLLKADVDFFFYKRKFDIDNLTYCAVWTEYMSGNDIASVFIQILEKVI